MFAVGRDGCNCDGITEATDEALGQLVHMYEERIEEVGHRLFPFRLLLLPRSGRNIDVEALVMMSEAANLQ